MRKGTVAYSVVLLLILASLIAFSPASAETIIGTAHYEPYKIDLSLPSPSVVKGTIRFPSEIDESVRDINVSTILLEGSLPPDTTYLIPGGMVAEFDGGVFMNMVWAKIYHIGELPSNRKVYLTITGNLIDSAGGTAFSATGDVKIDVHHSPPPP